MNSTKPNTAIALLSSGLDSSAAVAMYRSAGGVVEMALTLDYGQRASQREIAHARSLCEHFGIDHRVVSVGWMAEFPSGLTQSGTLPHPSRAQLDDSVFSESSAKAVWVPNRNGILIEIAAGFAESLRAADVIVGFNREEAATFPDNSSAYLDAINRALGFSTQGRVKVVSPTLSLNKREIVKWALENDFPLQKVWSCYESNSRMCGKCESCQRLKRAIEGTTFAEALFS